MRNFTEAARAAALSAAVMAAASLAAPAVAAELRLGDFQATGHVISAEGTVPWMEAVTKATGGAVAFAHFPSEQAAKAKGLLDAVTGGVLDVALIGPAYHGETLPLNTVIGLPGFYGSAVEGTEAFQAMLAEGPLRDEFLAQGVTPLWGFVLPPYQALAQKRLGGPSDWAGLDVRTAGATQSMTARSLGAVGVSIPGPEIYTAAERGRLDAILFPLASVPGYKLNEVVKAISTNGSFGGYSFVMAMRTEAFDKLPEPVRKAMLDEGATAAARVAKAQDESIEGLLAQWKAEGIDTYRFTDAALSALSEVMTAVRDDWLTRVGGGSEEARAVIAKFEAMTGR